MTSDPGSSGPQVPDQPPCQEPAGGVMASQGGITPEHDQGARKAKSKWDGRRSLRSNKVLCSALLRTEEFA